MILIIKLYMTSLNKIKIEFLIRNVDKEIAIYRNLFEKETTGKYIKILLGMRIIYYFLTFRV